MRYRVATLAFGSSPTGYVACAAVSSLTAAVFELSFVSTPTTATRPTLLRATVAMASSSARQSGHQEAKKLTMTGVPRNAASDTASLPDSAGTENAGGVVPGFRGGGGATLSAAVPGPVGCDGPRTITNTTKPTRTAPATAATHLNTRSAGLRGGPAG